MTSDPGCLFCRILREEIPATIVDRGEFHLAFRDISPQAPQHVLVIPREHIPALSAHSAPAQLGHLVAVAAKVGAELGGDRGFRLVINEGKDAGQTVDHLHLHILAGRELQWPPG